MQQFAMKTDSNAHAASTIEQRVDRELRANHKRQARTEREKLALAARILCAEGHASSLAGQLTAKISDDRYLTLPLGIGFDETEPENLLLVDDDLNVIEGKGMPNPATRFHIWIYRKKPSLTSIVHTHPPATSALAMIGTPLVVAHMDMCMFHNQCAYLPDWPGLPIGDEEGIIISAALGEKKAILLANHGLIGTGSSIEEATYLAVFFERASNLQLKALSAGTINAVDTTKAEEAGSFLLKPAIVEMTFDYWARQIARSQHRV